jgi:hypothetical protein
VAPHPGTVAAVSRTTPTSVASPTAIEEQPSARTIGARFDVCDPFSGQEVDDYRVQAMDDRLRRHRLLDPLHLRVHNLEPASLHHRPKPRRNSVKLVTTALRSNQDAMQRLPQRLSTAQDGARRFVVSPCEQRLRLGSRQQFDPMRPGDKIRKIGQYVNRLGRVTAPGHSIHEINYPMSTTAILPHRGRIGEDVTGHGTTVSPNVQRASGLTRAYAC